MILTFNPQFIEPIKAGTKIHTIRADKKGRWKPGTKIHFWKGNPRNKHQLPYQFQSGICTDVKFVMLDFIENDVLVLSTKFKGTNKLLTGISKLDEFAVNDGFENWECMKQWFLDEYPEIKVFEGKLIYFKLDEPC